MRVVFMGTPDFAVSALARIAEAHHVAAVYCQPARPSGRGHRLTPSPVEAFAARHAIPVCTPKSLKSADAQAAFAEWNADVAVVAAYGLILPPPVLAAPRFGCLNIHASLLPRWRGAAPIQRAIMAGDSVTGITIMQMDAGLDTGPMLLQGETPISDATTAGGLHDSLAGLGATLILRVLEAMPSGAIVARRQPDDGVTYAAKIDKAEAQIAFDKSASVVVRHIHGLSPFPGAWFTHGSERIKVLEAEAVAPAGAFSGAPGEVLDDQLTIACSTGAVRLRKVQRAGREAARAEAFLRGYALPKGTRLA